MKTPNVILYPDSMHSACSFWRGVGPFLELSRLNLINLGFGEYNESWTTLRSYDIAVFQRSMTKDCLHQIAMAKDLGLKIVVDVDDHNDIPKTHVVYNDYVNRYNEDSFIKIMMMADAVTTTTKYLKNHYSMYSGKIHIIPNAINNHWLSARKFKKTKSVFLRAGEHHEHDIYEYKDDIVKVMNENPDWTLEVAGHNPTFLREEVNNYLYVGDFDIHNYFAYILQSKASVFIVPLNDNKLNRGKSNISWQEATLSGASALVPEWMENETVGLSYMKETFYDSFSHLLENEDVREGLWSKSIDRLKKEYLLTNVNKHRLEILKNLL